MKNVLPSGAPHYFVIQIRALLYSRSFAQPKFTDSISGIDVLSLSVAGGGLLFTPRIGERRTINLGQTKVEWIEPEIYCHINWLISL